MVLKENTQYYVHVYYNDKTFTHSFKTQTYPTSLSEEKPKYKWEGGDVYAQNSLPKKLEWEKQNPLIITGAILTDDALRLKLDTTIQGGCDRATNHPNGNLLIINF